MWPIYQISNTDNYESIKAGFVVRAIEYETIVSTLEKRKTGDSIQHELILGRRGSGKSTLLKRIEVEILENEKLNVRYIPINPAEEQAGIYRLMDLWEQVLRELYYYSGEKYEIKNFSEFDDEREPVQAYTRYLYSEIHQFCETKKKKAVLLLDNSDRIFGNFSDDGNLLRETLINYRDVVLIAASTRMDEYFWKYDQPFYEFFRRHRLDTLSSEETFLLLNHWSESQDPESKEKMKNFLKKHPGKVENIRLLTDGLPRTMQFFLKFVMLAEKPVEIDFLKKIMDEATPLYQERLQNLTPQLRKIILEMAFMWEAAPTKKIAEQCRMENRLVAANLNTLTDRKIVETIDTDKRNKLYRIAERFFNMWLIVTQGNPDQKRKARWMSEFLESWYDGYELQTMALQHIENLKAHKISGEEAIMLSRGLSQSKYISTGMRDEIIDLTKVELKDDLKNYPIHLPKTARELYEEIISLEKTDPQKAIELVNSIENEENGMKYYNLGVLYDNQEKYDSAEKYYLMAIENGDKNAMFNLGLLYDDQEKYDLVEKYYLMAIENGDKNAMFNLALMYYFQNSNKERVKQYIGRYEGKDIGKIIIEIWAGVFNDVEERAIDACREQREDAFFIEDLLIHHQKSLVYKLFHHVEFGKHLQEKYTVLYYASQKLNGRENENNLWLRIPPELETTVEDVLKNIEKEQKRYSK